MGIDSASRRAGARCDEGVGSLVGISSCPVVARLFGSRPLSGSRARDKARATLVGVGRIAGQCKEPGCK